MTNTEAPARNTHLLADILRTHDMIAHSDANARGANFDGWVRFSHIAEYVDATEADIKAIVTDCLENMTSPTHKVDYIRPNAFMAYIVT